MFIFSVDINECTTGSNDCEQDCVNFEGRYNCKCKFGFELNTDRKTCKQGTYFLTIVSSFEVHTILFTVVRSCCTLINIYGKNKH
jgi:hypothetical protein